MSSNDGDELKEVEGRRASVFGAQNSAAPEAAGNAEPNAAGNAEPDAPRSGTRLPADTAAYEVRDARVGDMHSITSIYNQAIRQGDATSDVDERTFDQRIDWMGSHQPRSQYPVVVITCNGAVIGFGSLSRYRPRAGYDGVVELSYYIGQYWRGRGAGTVLVRWLLDAARSRGYRMAVSVVFTRNEGSTALMRKFGFTRFGVLPGGVVNDGVALDVAYWYKNLI